MKLNPSFAKAEQAKLMLNSAEIHKGRQPPMLLSDRETELVAGGGWFDDLLHAINTPPVVPTIASLF
jgi:hypothetical protein